MRDQLFLPIEKFSLFHRYYLFFDTEGRLAIPLFNRHHVRITAARQFRRESFSFVAVLCRVPKKDATRFDLAMEDLKKSMLITGHRTYQEEVSVMIDEMEAMKGKMKRKNGEAERQL